MTFKAFTSIYFIFQPNSGWIINSNQAKFGFWNHTKLAFSKFYNHEYLLKTIKTF